MIDLGKVRSRVQEILSEGNKFCCLVRDAVFQKEHSQKLRAHKVQLSQMKESCLDDENSANEVLALELMLEAQAHELDMWVALKDDLPADAWEHLISAQDALRGAVRAHEVAHNLGAYQQKLHMAEKLLFPPQLFFSISVVVRESICSICNSPYGECDHIVGRAYSGKLCSRIITKSEAREVSIVDDPANKRCRVLKITDGGITRDFFTWRPIPIKTSEGEGTH